MDDYIPFDHVHRITGSRKSLISIANTLMEAKHSFAFNDNPLAIYVDESAFRFIQAEAKKKEGQS
jgi:hypothetical protein